VRLEEDFDADPVLLPNASSRDPNAVEAWAREISPEEEVVVYCVRGHWVSQSVTKKLRDSGLNASQLTGGIQAWKAAGNPTTSSGTP
jgi:Fe-Mn family superoxide dismutase